MADLKMHAVLFQEEGWWVAQCLEHDIAAQARTQADLLYELQRLLAGYLLLGSELGRDLFHGMPKAPRRYWDLYERAKPLVSDISPLRVELPDTLPSIELRAA